MLEAEQDEGGLHVKGDKMVITGGLFCLRESRDRTCFHQNKIKRAALAVRTALYKRRS